MLPVDAAIASARAWLGMEHGKEAADSGALAGCGLTGEKGGEPSNS